MGRGALAAAPAAAAACNRARRGRYGGARALLCVVVWFCAAAHCASSGGASVGGGGAPSLPAIELKALFLLNGTLGGALTAPCDFRAQDPSLWAGVGTGVVGGALHVTDLRLGGCNLGGVVPAVLCSLTELVSLNMSGNPLLVGPLGSLCLFEGAEPAGLEVLDLSGCGFTGAIPASISALPRLWTLNLVRDL